MVDDLRNIERLGVMGGTFDPIHYGHLVAAEVARDRFSLDRVVFVPTGCPPHKAGRFFTDPIQRQIMTLLATVANPYFYVSSVEVERPGYSYSYDTLAYFRQCMGAGEIFFITGADAILDIPTWKNAEKLFDMCRFIAATRPGFDLSGVNNLPPHWRERIDLMEVPALAISSTDIRSRLQRGESVKYLLPETVENYIAKIGLYREEKSR